MLRVIQFKCFWTPRYRIQGVKGSRVQGKGLKDKCSYTRILESLKPLGLTLIEVILAMLIIGILSAVLIPKVDFAISTRASLEGAAYMVASDIRYAQEYSMANRISKSVTFTLGSSVYTFSPVSNFDPSGQLPPGVTINKDLRVKFNSLGEPTFEVGDGSVTISGGGQTKTISIVNYTGKVIIQ